MFFGMKSDFVFMPLIGVFLLQRIRADVDPCQIAENIGRPERSTAYVPDEAEQLMDDSALAGDQWYRFDAYTGSKMPEACVPIFHCGTYMPIWMNGKHPTAANPGPIVVPICAPYDELTCCAWSSTISVKRCTDQLGKEYFVYKLQPTDQFAGYCAGDGVICDPQFTWNTINSTCSLKYIPLTNPTLGQPYISGTKPVVSPDGWPFQATRFSINCYIGYTRQTKDDGVRFRVMFQAGGVTIATFNATSTDPVAALDEVYLRGHLGQPLTCTVQSYLASSPGEPNRLFSKTYQSNQFWIGVQPISASGDPVTTVLLQQGQMFTFRMQATFPITFAHCFDMPGPCDPEYQFPINATNQNADNCKFVLSVDSGTSCAITVTPVIVPVVKRSIIGRVQFGTAVSNTTDTIFKNYQIQEILVQINDSQPQPRCVSQGDPHIQPFNASIFYNIYEVGDFYLLRSTTMLIEIQVRQVLCFSQVSCNCGVIAREGNNILGINACDYLSSPRLIQYLLDPFTPPATIEFTGASWTINLLSGIRITVTLYDNNLGGKSMNIEVLGLYTDVYEGLCAQETNQGSTFDNFRVPASNSFFRFSSMNPPQCVNVTTYVPACICTGEVDSAIANVCNKTSVILEQKLPLLHTSYVCRDKRRRRATQSPAAGSDLYIDIDDVFASMDFAVTTVPTNAPPTSGLVPDRPHILMEVIKGPDWPTASGITQQQAEDQCNRQLRSSFAFSQCQNISDVLPIIDTCIQDIKYMDTLTAVGFAATIMEQTCVYVIKSGITDTGASPGGSDPQRALLQSVQGSICPSQCNNRGTCANQKCICYQGYVGDDCSLDQNVKPLLKSITSAQCDIRSSSCQTIYLNTANVYNSPSLVCKLEPQGVCAGNYSSTQTTNATFVPFGPVLCSTFSSPVLDNLASLFAVNVSVSNDGQVWSNSLTFTVFDGDCMTCDNTGCQDRRASPDLRGVTKCDGAPSNGSICRFMNNNDCIPVICPVTK